MCARLRTQSAERLAGGKRPHSYRARSLLACRFRSVAPRAIHSLVLPGRSAYVMERMKALADDLPDMGGPAIDKANRAGFLVDGIFFRTIAVAICRGDPRHRNALSGTRRIGLVYPGALPNPNAAALSAFSTGDGRCP